MRLPSFCSAYLVFLGTWKSLPSFTEFLDAYTEFLFVVPCFVEYWEGFTEFLPSFEMLILSALPSFTEFLESVYRSLATWKTGQ